MGDINIMDEHDSARRAWDEYGRMASTTGRGWRAKGTNWEDRYDKAFGKKKGKQQK